MKLKKITTLITISLLLLLFLGCQNNEEINLNPQTVLNDATSRINDWQSFKFRLEHEKGTTTISNGMELRVVEGEVVLPRRVKLTGKATVGGQFIELDIVLIDELSFMTNPLTGKWNQIDPEDSPFGNFDVREVIANILKMMKNPDFLSSPLKEEDLKIQQPMQYDILLDKLTGEDKGNDLCMRDLMKIKLLQWIRSRII